MEGAEFSIENRSVTLKTKIMKTSVLVALILLCLGLNQKSNAKIKNGYKIKLAEIEIRIFNLENLIYGESNPEKKRKLNDWIKQAYKMQKELRVYHQKTEALLVRLQTVDPELFNEINTIKDNKGNEPTIYVKIECDLGMPTLLGATNVAHCSDNPDMYKSEYGINTVSVRIADLSETQNLRILVHEFGHVRYLVPNLASYTDFYKKAYDDTNVIGHGPLDPSHRSVMNTLKSFNKTYSEYKSNLRKQARLNKSELHNSISTKEIAQPDQQN